MIEKTEIDRVTSSRGAQWAGAGSLIGLAAASLLGNGNLGGILGRNTNGQNDDLKAALAFEKAKTYTDEVAKESFEKRADLLKEMNRELVALRERATIAETEAKCRETFFTERDKRRDIEIELAILKATDPLKQAIQRNSDSIVMVDERLKSGLALEAERRCTADNALVNYVNCTFVPQVVCGVKCDEATAEPKSTYNPLPCCDGGGCGRGCGRGR